jgi:ABC-type branched-subunit amino acid transport system substrate-binding protein
VVGPTGTALTLAVKPEAEQTGLVLIGFVGAESAEGQPPTKYWFRSTFSDIQVMPALMAFLKNEKAQKIAYISPSDSVGQSGLDVARTAATQQGLTLVTSQQYPPNVTDATVQILAAKAANPDAYVVWDTVDPVRAARILKTMREQGITQRVATAQTAGQDSYRDAAGLASVEGIVYWASFAADDPLPGPQADFFTAYRTAKGKAPGDATLGGCTMGQILVEGMRRVVTSGKELTRQSLRDAVEALRDFKTAYGTVNYSPTAHGTPFGQMVIATYKQGKRVIAAQVPVPTK